MQENNNRQINNSQPTKSPSGDLGVSTLFDKIWDAHVVTTVKDGPTQLYIDKHLCHEVTSPQAFSGLRERGLKVFRPEQTLLTADHNIPTMGQDKPIQDEVSRFQVDTLAKNAKEFGLTYYAAFPGCSTDTEANPATIAFLVDKVKEDHIPVVFHIEMSNEQMSKAIAEATGAKNELLNAVHNVSDEEFKKGVTYIDLMNHNVKVLKEALN